MMRLKALWNAKIFKRWEKEKQLGNKTENH